MVPLSKKQKRAHGPLNMKKQTRALGPLNKKKQNRTKNQGPPLQNKQQKTGNNINKKGSPK
jgi:hypothetical protein